MGAISDQLWPFSTQLNLNCLTLLATLARLTCCPKNHIEPLWLMLDTPIPALTNPLPENPICFLCINIPIRIVAWWANEIINSIYRTRVRSLAMLVTHWLTHWLTDSLTDSCLVNLIDVTLAFEDANSKLVEVFIVADVDDEDRVGNSLLQIWKRRFGHKIKLSFRLWPQDLVKILKLKFRQDLKQELVQYFAADVL